MTIPATKPRKAALSICFRDGDRMAAIGKPIEACNSREG
jgi:hypothetical protein